MQLWTYLTQNVHVKIQSRELEDSWKGICESTKPQTQCNGDKALIPSDEKRSINPSSATEEFLIEENHRNGHHPVRMHLISMAIL